MEVPAWPHTRPLGRQLHRMSKRLAALHQNAPRAAARGPHVPHDFFVLCAGLGARAQQGEGDNVGSTGSPPSRVRYLPPFPLLQLCPPD